MLAPAHVRFEFPSLPERHPERGAITLGHGRTPKQQDIDATVGRAVVTAGCSDAAFGACSISTASARDGRRLPGQQRSDRSRGRKRRCETGSYSSWSVLLSGLGCCAHAHAPMPIGEIGGSKATRAGGREGDHPACTSAARKVGETRPRGRASPFRAARGRAH